MGGNTLDIPKDNLVLLRDHPEGRHKIQDNYKSKLCFIVLTHKNPNVFTICPMFGVQCIWSTDNCLTLENHPFGIVRILIPQTHPLKLTYPFTNLTNLSFYQPNKIKLDNTPHQHPYGTRSKTQTSTILQSPNIDEDSDLETGFTSLVSSLFGPWL